MAKAMTIDDLRGIIPNASFFGKALIIKGIQINEQGMRALNQFLFDNADSIHTLNFSESSNDSRVPLDVSWIARANILEQIFLIDTTNIISDNLIEQIIKNNSIRGVHTGASKNFPLAYSYHDHKLAHKINVAMEVRSAKDAVLLDKIDDKFGQLAFNNKSHTWLPYDVANKKWKLTESTYYDCIDSFNIPGINLPAPAGFKISKIDILKAEFMNKISGMKHDTTAVKAELMAKIGAQQTLNSKLWNAWTKQDIPAMKEALAEGGDLYIRHYGKILPDCQKSYYNVEVRDFLTKAQAAQEARDEAAKVAEAKLLDHAASESDASASSGGAGANLHSQPSDDVHTTGEVSAAVGD